MKIADFFLCLTSSEGSNTSIQLWVEVNEPSSPSILIWVEVAYL